MVGCGDLILLEKGFLFSCFYSFTQDILRSLTETTATITISKNNIEVAINFSESFTAQNTFYRGRFYLIEQYAAQRDDIVINTTGQVQKNGENGYEIFVFRGNGLLVHGKSIHSLAIEYSS
ncbi:hypothetical protein [Shouchella patagoniensis]|uniref:hypothetical protein n=1 Tax=Shouchella patagoniensis TaxID=228576 RepID=UPI0009952ED6|nr:hypothetical protein [Shouchella patagoniensis]